MAKVTFNEEKCKGCGLCVNFCPKHILQMAPVDQDACIGCASCARMCPDVVITIEK